MDDGGDGGMMVLVTGGSGSGKSAYAEDEAVRLSGGGPRYYLAAMQVTDAEGAARVKRHRELRSEKGFRTIEQPTGISGALGRMEPGVPGRTALVECLSNLTANEMFAALPPGSGAAVREKILRELGRLNRELANLVVVTNNVFEDGIRYDDATEAYRTALGEINVSLAEMADRVVEVVAGIPVTIKG